MVAPMLQTNKTDNKMGCILYKIEFPFFDTE